MAAIFGLRGTGDWTTPDERPKNYHEKLFQLVPEVAPFYGILSKLGQDSVDDPEFKVFEERLPQQHAYVTAGGCDNVTTTIPIDDPSTPAKAFKAGDLLKNMRTGEIIRVVQDPSDPWTSLIVATRGSWGGGAAAMLENDELRWVGSAYEEAANAPTAISQTLSVPYNYIQVFRDSCEITEVADKTKLRPEPAYVGDKRRAMIRHMLKIELALLFGARVETTGEGGKPLRGTGGLDYWITTNVNDDSAGVSIDTLEDRMQAYFKYGSKTKVGFAGAGALTRLNRIVRNNVAMNFDMGGSVDKKQTYGLNVREFYTPHGTLQLIPHPALTESSNLTNRVFIIDTKAVKWVTLKGMDTKFFDNVKTDDGYTGRKGEWRTYAGLRLALQEVHADWIVGPYLP